MRVGERGRVELCVDRQFGLLLRRRCIPWHAPELHADDQFRCLRRWGRRCHAHQLHVDRQCGARNGRRGLSANEIVTVVQAWQNGALSRDSMLDIFRRGEVLPEGRTNEEEVRLLAIGKPEPAPQPKASSGL